jgi:predicted permease
MIERLGDRMSGQAWVPLSGIALGAILLGAEASHGDWVAGLVWLALLAVPSALLLFGRPFEAIRQARGGGGDEREQMIDQRAMAFAGIVLVVALTGALLVELVQGDDPRPYIPILAVGGLACVAALLWLRRRS